MLQQLLQNYARFSKPTFLLSYLLACRAKCKQIFFCICFVLFCVFKEYQIVAVLNVRSDSWICAHVLIHKYLLQYLTSDLTAQVKGFTFVCLLFFILVCLFVCFYAQQKQTRQYNFNAQYP